MSEVISNGQEFTELDELMGFDPNNTKIFNTVDGTVATENIYRTSPKDSKTEDGHYHAKVRLLYNVHNRKRTIVHNVTYRLQDADGFFSIKSMLGESDPNSPYFGSYKNCPIFKAWKKLHFSGDDAKDRFAKEVFEKTESDYILVQVIEDKNKPEMVGRILPWKLPRAVSVKLQSKMYPSKDSGKAPVNLLDLLVGRVLDLDVTPGPNDKSDPTRYYRETKYDLSEFDTEPQPIIKTDGTPFFTDDEAELIEKYDKKLTAIAKMKTPEEQANAQKLLKENELYAKVRELMVRAYEYVKENCDDLVDTVGYKPWTEEQTARVQKYIEQVLAGVNPKTESPAAVQATGSDIDAIFGGATATKPAVNPPSAKPEFDDDLPF